MPTENDKDGHKKTIKVPTVKTISDRRQSFRMQSGCRAVLRIGRRDMVVELGDESSGGFMVWMDESPGFKVHTVAMLRTGRGWSTVRIAHIEQIEGRHRLGLEFLVDMDDPRQRRFSVRGGRRWVTAHAQANDWIAFIGVVLFASLAGLGVIAYVLFPEMEIWHQLSRLGVAARRTLQAVSPF